MTAADPARLADTPLLAAIAWIYLAVNATRVFTYVPQIVAAWRCTDGARAISLLTWSSWVVSHLTGLAYGALVLHDAFFLAITAINLLGCGAVTAIVAAHRWRLRRRQAGPSSLWMKHRPRRNAGATHSFYPDEKLLLMEEPPCRPLPPSP